MSYEIEALTHRIKSLELERDLWKSQAYSWSKAAGKPLPMVDEKAKAEAIEQANQITQKYGVAWPVRYEEEA